MSAYQFYAALTVCKGGLDATERASIGLVTLKVLGTRLTHYFIRIISSELPVKQEKMKNKKLNHVDTR